MTTHSADTISPNAQPDYMQDAKGRLVPIHLVPETERLKDQTVRKIMEYAVDLSEQIARFKAHTFDDVSSLMDLLAEQYDTKIGGRKGNVEIQSFDGLCKVSVQVSDHISFGPELQIAKELIDLCIKEWAEGASDEIRVLVDHAFQTDKPGQINREALFSLRRMNIKHPKWQSAMSAISDSMRVVGSKAYVRIHVRSEPDKPWELVQLNVASV